MGRNYYGKDKSTTSQLSAIKHLAGLKFTLGQDNVGDENVFNIIGMPIIFQDINALLRILDGR